METPTLKLPLVAAGQAQKHVTVNEALMALDALAQIGVESATLTTPPLSPAPQQRYLVPTGATGVWSGKTGRVALFSDGIWQFYAPSLGWMAYVRDDDRQLVYDGANWRLAVGGTTAAHVTIRVPEDRATIQSALNALMDVRFSGTAQGIVDVAAGTYTIATALNCAHPQGNRIVLRGRSTATAIDAPSLTGVRATDEALVRARFPVVLECSDTAGISLSGGDRLSIQDLALIRSGTAGTSRGIFVDRQSLVTLTRVAMVGFGTGLMVSGRSLATLGAGVASLHGGANGVYGLDGGEVLGSGPVAAYNGAIQVAADGGASVALSGGHLIGGTTGIFINKGATGELSGATIRDSSSNGSYAQVGSCMILTNVTIQNVGLYVVANLTGSQAMITSLTVSGTNKAVFSNNGSVCHQVGTHTGAPTFSPAIGTTGNGNAYTA